ncbi:MAG UNVERIFIED_CONTAM: UDP-N-acetylmuramoyl-L-alanyl-D-glutamate--2,6-diaminopimelate ligase [Rickettsiaceae bacterium]
MWIILRQILTLLGIKSASIGTMGILCSDKTLEKRLAEEFPIDLTTPDVLTMHRILNILSQENVEYVAFEASSHALDQLRLYGIKAHVAIFTNLSQDHLDYHKTMSEYKKAKLKLFANNLKEDGAAIISTELSLDNEIMKYLKDCGITPHCEKLSDEAIQHERHCEKLSDEAIHNDKMDRVAYARDDEFSKPTKELITVGKDGTFNITSCVSTLNGQNIEFINQGKKYNIDSGIVGSFQANNILMSIAAIMKCGIDLDDVIRIVPNLKSVTGRLEKITTANHLYHIFVDYAHKPNALEETLLELKKLRKARLIVLFGCGGNRDTGKRAIMGEIAERIADMVIVTDDNPRKEDAASIRKQVIEGAPNALEIAPREAAIAYGVKILKEQDILVIAGKGHEDYQIIGTEKQHFNDAEEVRKYI